MNILLGIAACAIVLLALDLLTAPKQPETIVRAKLKHTRRAA